MQAGRKGKKSKDMCGTIVKLFFPFLFDNKPLKTLDMKMNALIVYNIKHESISTIRSGSYWLSKYFGVIRVLVALWLLFILIKLIIACVQVLQVADLP